MLAPGTVDGEGRDSEDYASILLLRAWSAIWKYRTAHWRDLSEAHVAAERAYVYRTLWNERISLQRSAARRGLLRTQLQFVLPTAYELGGQVEARKALGELQSKLRPADWEVLFRVGMAGGVVAEAYDGGSRRTWFAKARRARDRAQAAL
jgi:DNA-directed RNA polymerase specialized sigma24 family protein